MKSIAFLVAIFVLPLSNYCQITFEKIYDDSGYSFGSSIVQTYDGGYALTGRHSSGKLPLIRINPYGDTIWTRTFGYPVYNNEYGKGIIETSDHGFALIGMSFKLFRTDSNGDSLWTKQYLKEGTQSYSNSFIQLSDNGYIIAGVTDWENQGGICSIYLVRTDEFGVTLWTKTIEGNYDESNYFISRADDNGFVLTGKNFFMMQSSCFIKFDQNGTIQWSKNFGGWQKYFAARSVINVSTGGYLIAGRGNQNGNNIDSVMLLRTDTNGDTLWLKSYRGINSNMAEYVVETDDGGFVVTGTTANTPTGSHDVYLMKTDENGDLMWNRSFGGTEDDNGYCGRQTSDGGYVVTISARSFGGNNRKIYVIKTDGDGIVTTGDQGFTTSISDFEIFPNPTSGKLKIQSSAHFGEVQTIKIYDLTGKLMYKQYGNHTSIDIGHLKSGIYLLALINVKGETLTTKILKE